MALISCRQCGRPVADDAAACPACGTRPAPTGRPLRGLVAKTDRDATTGLRIGQAAAAVACLLIGLVTAWAGPDEGPGYALGFALAPFLLAAILLVWFRKARRYIPFVALGITLIPSVDNRSEGGTDEPTAEEIDELASLRSTAAAFLDSSATSPALAGGRTPPEGDRAKMAWMVRRLMEDAVPFTEERAARHGLDLDNPPAAWGTARYMANAGSHPEVERYWASYSAYLRDMRQAYPAWAEAHVERLAREAGVRWRDARAIQEGIRTAAGREIATLDQSDEVAAAALAYHRYLVSVDARVQYDAGEDMAMFDSDDELQHATELQERLVAAAESLERARKQAMESALGAVERGLQ